MKRYEETVEGKRAFVAEVLSPLLVQANTGWSGAYYTTDIYDNEYVKLYTITPNADYHKHICITADSLVAIVRDVFGQLH